MRSILTVVALIAATAAQTEAQERSLHYDESRSATEAVTSFVRRRAVQPGYVRGIAVSVLKPPQQVTGDGRQQLIWELAVRNDRSEDVTLTALEVIAASNNTAVASYSGQALRDIIASDRISAGQTAVIFILVTRDNLADVPSTFTHQLRFNGSQGEETYGGPLVQINLQLLPVLSAPVTAGSIRVTTRMGAKF